MTSNDGKQDVNDDIKTKEIDSRGAQRPESDIRPKPEGTRGPTVTPGIRPKPDETRGGREGGRPGGSRGIRAQPASPAIRPKPSDTLGAHLGGKRPPK